MMMDSTRNLTYASIEGEGACSGGRIMGQSRGTLLSSHNADASRKGKRMAVWGNYEYIVTLLRLC